METNCAVCPPAPAPQAGRACRHEPPCPPPAAPGRLAARIIATHPEQGWSLLCNGIIAFEDGGTIAPGD